MVNQVAQLVHSRAVAVEPPSPTSRMGSEMCVTTRPPVPASNGVQEAMSCAPFLLSWVKRRLAAEADPSSTNARIRSWVNRLGERRRLCLLPASASSQSDLYQHPYFAGRLCERYELPANSRLAFGLRSVRSRWPSFTRPRKTGRKWRSKGLKPRKAAGLCCSPPGDLTLRQANVVLSEAGFRGVMRLDDVVRLDAIPILGTGKTDDKLLRAWVA